MVFPDDQRFMTEALKAAELAASLGEVPVGALVVLDGEILATAHAELLAIRAAAQRLGDWRLERCVVYVTLEPCAMCAGAMVLARVSRVVYGCHDPKGGFLGTLGDLSQVPGLNHRYEVVSGVEADASAGLLRSFFRRLRAREA